MKINQSGFIGILFVILMIVGIADYLVVTKRSLAPVQISPSTESANPLPSPPPAHVLKNEPVLLKEQFTAKKNQLISVANTDLQIRITNFYNSPCPANAECFWSGVGVELEYIQNGKSQKGMNLLEAFGYHTTIIKTDYETYADLIVERMYR